MPGHVLVAIAILQAALFVWQYSTSAKMEYRGYNGLYRQAIDNTLSWAHRQSTKNRESLFSVCCLDTTLLSLFFEGWLSSILVVYVYSAAGKESS